MLVLAGAGSGKTRVITVRIAHLLAKGVDPRAILALTFTNKAAAEMRERVAGLGGAGLRRAPTLGTFHAFASLPGRARHALGYPRGFTICDSSDQIAVLRGDSAGAARGGNQHPTGRPALAHLPEKNKLVSAAAFLGKAADDREELIGKAWLRYEEHLLRARSMDFDDLLLNAVKLLGDHPKVKQALAARYRYVMVDEYQDTNTPQYEIVRLIGAKHGNVCVVGDDDQSIYGWRGADISNILSLRKGLGGRGGGAAGDQLPFDLADSGRGQPRDREQPRPARQDACLRARQRRAGDGGGPGRRERRGRAHRAASARPGAQGTRQVPDYAILFRTGTQPRPFEQQLRARTIPYVLVGGMSFFDRKEVRDVLALSAVVRREDDEVSPCA
ncbi:MAG: ATP-dependent helicase [Planctomycetes bacterium]|nr:ATP-dependent helicase [Planctomycetota bacterium]